MTEETVVNNFTYHPPKPENVPLFEKIRRQAREFALQLARDIPEGPERTLAIRKLEEAVMWANAALARH